LIKKGVIDTSNVDIKSLIVLSPTRQLIKQSVHRIVIIKAQSANPPNLFIIDELFISPYPLPNIYKSKSSALRKTVSLSTIKIQGALPFPDRQSG